jgi:hypothetical protein
LALATASTSGLSLSASTATVSLAAGDNPGKITLNPEITTPITREQITVASVGITGGTLTLGNDGVFTIESSVEELGELAAETPFALGSLSGGVNTDVKVAYSSVAVNLYNGTQITVTP